ncbi:hypothetical protein L202_04902 [Cryptococcus amylolentus CBS 6039]|uniref:FAD dependent oxidoreductase domain-containing protein n=1 Tax=Cryptococcus amylolentus CBS 6039 TaxID=1295533 RepID=A0A1E3HN68_9TREE|nr:hypothetical protein L202_04902 [Cryptococcus amylolentus CBS 6039]ODN77772.1 hypothetical protein L202_04902 [Cryptococcus amylolentus CBS 6039]
MPATTPLPPVGGEATQTSLPTPPQHPTTGLPLDSGFSLSLWLQTVRNNPLLDHRSTESLPAEAEVVVIGSGISGSLCAKSLLESDNPPKSVVLLEARELSSGATGRNAGHCKPDQWRGFTKYEELHGIDQALKILANEQETWEALVSYVKKNDVQCDLWVGKTLDVCMTDGVADIAAKTFADYKAAGGDVSKIEVTADPLKAEQVSRIKGAKSVYAWDASTLHPWKLVAHIVQSALDLGLNLQTWTPVTAVTGSAHQWTVHTERGEIKASKVVHCTNAYAGVLLPETKGAINPTPHMCNKVIPPTSHSGTKALCNSYAVLYPTGMYSINPRFTSDGAVLFGGSAPNQYKLLEYVAEDPEKRATDDGLINFEPVTEAVRNLGSDGLEWDLAPGERGTAPRYDYAWSGIIGRSADRLPFIGAVPDKPGQYMSCGHNGHGMARTFTCSKGLAQVVQGLAWKDTGLPESFEVTKERLDKLRK